MELARIDEAEATELLEAYRIARRYFPKLDANQLLDAIDLCRKAGGLYVSRGITFATFQYHPGQVIGGKRMLDIIAEWDIETLKQLDLSQGPILHIMFFSTTGNCQRVFRRMVDAINPEGCSAHRFKKNGDTVFSVRKNARHK